MIANQALPAFHGVKFPSLDIHQQDQGLLSLELDGVIQPTDLHLAAASAQSGGGWGALAEIEARETGCAGDALLDDLPFSSRRTLHRLAQRCATRRVGLEG